MTKPPTPDQRRIPSLGAAIYELRDKPPVMVVDKDIGQRQTRPAHDPEPMPVIGTPAPQPCPWPPSSL